MKYKKRCRDCTYLVADKKDNWVCDIDNKKCKEIEHCNAVEKCVKNKT